MRLEIGNMAMFASMARGLLSRVKRMCRKSQVVSRSPGRRLLRILPREYLVRCRNRRSGSVVSLSKDLCRQSGRSGVEG